MKSGLHVGLAAVLLAGPVAAGIPWPGGVPWSLLGTVEMEDFDQGGEGTAFHDTTAANEGGQYRPAEAVDIWADPGLGNGHAVGWTLAGEWLVYTIEVPAAGTYPLVVNMAAYGSGGRFRVLINGEIRTPSLSVPDTGSWYVHRTAEVARLYLEPGVQEVRFEMLEIGTGGAVASFDWFRFAPPLVQDQMAFPDGVPWPVPGLVEMENADLGGEGAAYHDLTAANEGWAWRPDEGLDIWTDPGLENRHAVGWTLPGEWIEYTLDVSARRNMALEFHLAAFGAGGAFRVRINGEDRTGIVSVPDTGSWYDHETHWAGNLLLESGIHTMRVEMVTAGTGGAVASFDWFRFGPPVDRDPVVPDRIGNPLLSRFPVSGDARPRSVWDLHFFDNRIYIGHGDYWFNRGPIDIWTYAGNGSEFAKETTVAEEMVWDYFDYDGRLFIPGYDATETGSAIANVHYKDPGAGWVKRRTLSGGVHSFDVAPFQGRLYAGITLESGARTLVSDNNGLSWSVLLNQYSSLVVFDDFLFLEGDRDYVWNGITLREVTPDLPVPMLAMARKARYRDGLLFAYPLRYGLTNSALHFITADGLSAGSAARTLPRFAAANVRDVVVRGEACFVLTAEELVRDASYRGVIHASTDLTNWIEAAEFTLPGIPLSFEIMDNAFVVGIGSRFDPDQGWDRLIGPEAGSLWRVQPVPLLTVVEPDGTGSVGMDVLAIPGFGLELRSTPDLQNPVWTVRAVTNAPSGWFRIEDAVPPGKVTRYYQVAYE